MKFAVMADVFLGGLASVLEHGGHLKLLYRGGLDSRRQQELERWCEVGGIGVRWGKIQFILVVGGNTDGAWVLLVVAIMGWVGMEVVGRENVGYRQDELATQWDVPEHFLCARWKHW